MQLQAELWSLLKIILYTRDSFLKESFEINEVFGELISNTYLRHCEHVRLQEFGDEFVNYIKTVKKVSQKDIKISKKIIENIKQSDTSTLIDNLIKYKEHLNPDNLDETIEIQAKLLLLVDTLIEEQTNSIYKRFLSSFLDYSTLLKNKRDFLLRQRKSLINLQKTFGANRDLCILITVRISKNYNRSLKKRIAIIKKQVT
jgi:phage-related protein